MMRRLRRWWNLYRNPAFVTISQWGQLTPRPQVTVSVLSERGSQSVYTYDSNDQGEASATMHGRRLAYILGVRLVDERSPNSGGSDRG